MLKHNQNGAVSGVGISLIFAIVFLVAAIAFGGWAFMGRLDYKNNTDSKIKDAVVIAKQQEGSAKDAAFAEAEKLPFKTYQGPEAYGSLVLSYPKTWSGFIDDSGKASSGSGAVIDGYFYPGIVPSLTDPASVFSLRVQVINQPYAQVLTSLTSNYSSSSDKTPPAITPYALPKVPKTVGIKLVGTLPNTKQGTMVVLPLRAQTLELWSETAQFTPDFETNILPNFSFSP